MSQDDQQTPARKFKIALGVSGGIAAYKAIEVLRGLQRLNCDVRVAMTSRACEFVQPLTFRALSGHHVVVDDYAPDNPDPIAHITFSQSVDLFVVAPATANIISKFANGIADDFVTSTYLACTAPVLVAPAMNTTMLEQPATQRNLAQLKADGVYIVEPDSGEMACGTVGPGRLSEPDQIVTAAWEILNQSQKLDLKEEHLLITVGATREELDPVRFISNRSSGKMGFALAKAALERGAKVTAIVGATSVNAPAGIDVVNVSSAGDMANAVANHIRQSTVFIGAAAVADYRPVKRADQKLKKSDQSVTIELEKTPDILSYVSSNRNNGMLVIGFAAETENLLANASTKLQAKNLDAIIANDVTRKDSGFDSDVNAITIIERGSTPTSLPLMSKKDAANQILDLVVRLRTTNKSTSTSN
jgi:phosphopantothenoylcysteine decarboxylase / phosphopantothenate---cysteine ligase